MLVANGTAALPSYGAAYDRNYLQKFVRYTPERPISVAVLLFCKVPRQCDNK